MSRGIRGFLLLILVSLMIFSGSPRDLHSQGGGGTSLSALLGAMNSFDTFRANITINGSLSGTLSYKKPGNIHVKFSDGREISSNGRVLYFYSPDRGVTGKQDLKGSTSGIGGLLSGYQETTVGKTIKLKSPTRRYSEITVSVDAKNLPKSIRMVSQNDAPTEILFSNVSTGLGLSASLFNYQPPTSSIIIENPLNQKE